MSASIYALAKTAHLLGLGAAIGASLVALHCHRSAMSETAPAKSGLEVAAASAITFVELPGVFLAMFAGLVLLALNPNALDARASGAGPWLHIKLLLVLGALVVSHLRMFRSRRLVRERKAGASEAECESFAGPARTLGMVDSVLLVGIVALATLRFVLFGGVS